VRNAIELTVNRYLRAISANYLFLAVNTVFFLVITPVAIRLMGLEFYGLWAILTAILLFSSVGTLGMSVVVNKFGAEEGESALKHDAIITAGATILFPMATVIALILLLSRHWISYRLVSDPVLQLQLSSALVFTALSLYPQFLSRVAQGYLFSQLRYDLAQMVETGTNIALWSGAVWIAWITHDLVWMAVWGFSIQVVSLSVYLTLMARRGVLRWRWELLALRRIGHFSLFTFIQSLAVSLFQNLDRIVVGFVLGPAVAGVYSVGTSVGLRLSIVTGQITDVLVPFASRKASLEQREGLYEVFREVSQIINLMLMVSGALLILWMDTILRYWISSEYSDAYANSFRILVVAYMLLSASRPGLQTLVGIGQVRLPAMIYLSSSVVMLISLFYASSSWGLAGAAGSNLWMILLLSNNVLALRYLGEPIKIKNALIDLFKLAIFPFTMYTLVVFIPLNILLRLFMTCLAILIALIPAWRDAELRKQIRCLVGEFTSRA
jgi:O-antigen/teichoic acid export membrane protein